MSLLATCRILCDVEDDTLRVLCSERRAVLQPKIMTVFFYQVRKFFALGILLSRTHAKQHLALIQNEAFPGRICFGNNSQSNQMAFARIY